MAKKKKGQATIYKILHKKLNKSNNMNPTDAPRMNSGVPDGKAVPALLVKGGSRISS